MNIDYVLLAHGIGRKSGGGKITYESVANLTSQSINNGDEILVTWDNPTIDEFVKVELFASESDLTNLDYEQTVAIATKVVEGTEESYTHPSTIGVTYYFKAFVTYFTFGNNVISKGATSFITASDKTPPNPITNFVGNGDDQSVNLSWTNPTDADFNKVKIVYKTGNHPTSHADGTVAYEGSGTSTTVSGLANEVEYFFRAFTFDTSNNINDDVSQQVTATPVDVKIYGVKIDTTNSNPFTAVTYTDSAVGMTPAPAGGGASDWDNVYPFNQIRPCLLLNGAVNYYLDPNDFTKKIDGSPADITTGADGDVMIEFPKIWWKFERVGTDLFVRYATRQVDSTWKCLAHTKGSTEKDFVYISAYLGFLEYGGKFRSLNGKTVETNQVIGAYRNWAINNGQGYQLIGYYQLLMLQVLYLIRYKSLDSQTALGRGYVDGNSAKTKTGGTNQKGMYFGESTGKQQMKFGGIEDFWGNTRCWIDGIKTAQPNLIQLATTGFNDAGTGYASYISEAPSVAGQISDVQGSTETGFIVKASAGSTTTYYCDYGNLTTSSERFALSGGAWNDGSSSGIFYLHLGTPNSGQVNGGTRLCYL